MNVYDVRLVDEYPACGMNWPPELTDVYTYLRVSLSHSFLARLCRNLAGSDNLSSFLQRPDVVSALHATDHKSGWTECEGNVGANLWNDKSPASIGLFPSLLEKIPILLFAGAEDLICNHKGIERLVDRLEWNGAKGLGVSPSQPTERLLIPILADSLGVSRCMTWHRLPK